MTVGTRFQVAFEMASYQGKHMFLLDDLANWLRILVVLMVLPILGMAAGTDMLGFMYILVGLLITFTILLLIYFHLRKIYNIAMAYYHLQMQGGNYT